MTTSCKHAVFNIDNQGLITKIIVNSFGNGLLLLGHSFITSIHPTEIEVYLDYISKIKLEHLGWIELKLHSNDKVLFTMSNNETIFLLQFDSESEKLFHPLFTLKGMFLNSQTSKLDNETKNLIEDFMKINNDLINTKRELKRKNQQLEHINYHDFLTKIFNRRKFFIDIYQLVKETEYTLIMLDFNNFKLINDTFGHNFGDKVLIDFSNLLQDMFKEYNGLVYRLGGDEFAILVETIKDEEITLIFTNLTKRLKDIHPLFGISYGSTPVNKDNCNQTVKAETNMRIADEKMYIMKQESKRQ